LASAAAEAKVSELRGSIRAVFHSLWIYTMNRCKPSAPTSKLPALALNAAPASALRRRLGQALFAGVAFSLLSSPAWAQFGVRSFPAKTERGAMLITQPPELLMNGKPARFSPGARIRGTNNLMILSGTLVGQNLLVNFLREPQGMIHEVWILTEAEAALPLPSASTQP
jgi:hypothetical protein